MECIGYGNGRHVYAEGDMEWIQFIRRLKETGMPLKNIQQYAKLRYLGANTMPKRLEMFQFHREYVLEQQKKWEEYLQNLEHKIDFYQQAIVETSTVSAHSLSVRSVTSLR